MKEGDDLAGTREAVERNLRLFVGVEVPEPQFSASEEAAASLRPGLPDGRWVPRSNRHVTLKFLGPTPADRLDAVTRLCGTVARSHEPATSRVVALGAFPSVRRARVLWAGLADETDLLARLARDLEQAFEAIGYAGEDRPFTPHLTLARFKVPVRLPDELPAIPPAEPFPVASIELFRSRLSPKGARYEILESFPLGESRITGR